MEAYWSQHSAIPAKQLLAHFRPDLSAAQQRSLLGIDAAYLGFSRCSFGRRGQPVRAIRNDAELRSLMAVCKVARKHMRVMSCERAIRCPKGVQ
jgi:hypothetical protein